MPIAIPVLDDKSFDDLMREARALITVHDPGWTDHNASDPGITLIELFAWLVEAQIYTLDQITDQHRLAFLRLLAGPEAVPGADDGRPVDPGWLAAKTAEVIRETRRLTRAVSAADHETLACRVENVGRALCLPRHAPDADGRLAPGADGHVSVVVLPRDRFVNAEALAAAVRTALEPARMLTTRLHVVPPAFVPVSSRIVVARRSDAKPDELATAIRNRLASWLDAWGGDEGWRFGRDVYVSDLLAVLEAIRGVDCVGAAMLDSRPEGNAARGRAAPQIWHSDGASVGLALGSDQFPATDAAAHQILVADRLEPVRITVKVKPTKAGTGDQPAARRAVVQAVQEFLWRLQKDACAPGGAALRAVRPIELFEGELRDALSRDPSVGALTASFAITIGPGAAPRGGAAPGPRRFDAGTLLEADVRAAIEGAP